MIPCNNRIRLIIKIIIEFLTKLKSVESLKLREICLAMIGMRIHEKKLEIEKQMK